MSIKYTNINHCNLTKATGFYSPKSLPELVYLEDPAVDVMFDFKYHAPATITSSENIDEALQHMKLMKQQVLLVINDEQQTVGLISSSDVQGAKPVKISQERGIEHSAISVEMLMNPIEQVHCIAFKELKLAHVGDVVQTLKETQQHYLVVLKAQGNGNEEKIRGIFSASQIEKQLHHSVRDELQGANNLAELTEQTR